MNTADAGEVDEATSNLNCSHRLAKARFNRLAVEADPSDSLITT